MIAPHWRGAAPRAGSFVRLVPQSGRSVLVCNDALETLGAAVLPLDPGGAVLNADVLADGRLHVGYLGPDAASFTSPR